MMNKTVPHAQDVVHKLYEDGVPLVLGTDAGNFEAFTTMFHAVSTLDEYVLLAEASTPQNALNAATINAATMLGREADSGSVDVGKRAELVVLPRSPLQDPTAVWEPQFVIHGGLMHTPAEWMAASGVGDPPEQADSPRGDAEQSHLP